jgi:predicted component of type VI protein secretion system
MRVTEYNRSIHWTPKDLQRTRSFATDKRTAKDLVTRVKSTLRNELHAELELLTLVYYYKYG